MKNKLNRRDENGKWIPVRMADRPSPFTFIAADYTDEVGTSKLSWWEMQYARMMLFTRRHLTLSWIASWVILTMPLMWVWDVSVWYLFVVGIPMALWMRSIGWLEDNAQMRQMEKMWRLDKYKQSMESWDAKTTYLDKENDL